MLVMAQMQAYRKKQGSVSEFTIISQIEDMPGFFSHFNRDDMKQRTQFLSMSALKLAPFLRMASRGFPYVSGLQRHCYRTPALFFFSSCVTSAHFIAFNLVLGKGRVHYKLTIG